VNPPPHRIPGVRPSTRADRATLPKCGAKNRAGKPCGNAAGYKTDHIGSGKCFLHGGIGQQAKHRYATLNASPRLKELLDLHAADTDPYNLLPELNLFRAMCADYIERHHSLTAALTAWHASYSSGYDQEVALWRERLAQWTELKDLGEEGEPPRPPIPEAFEAKPRQLPDILAVSGYLDKIGAMVERIQKRESEKHMTLSDVRRVFDDLGVKVVMAVREVIPDDAQHQEVAPADLRAELVAAIERHWATVNT
jgi:hypothetical protein